MWLAAFFSDGLDLTISCAGWEIRWLEWLALVSPGRSASGSGRCSAILCKGLPCWRRWWTLRMRRRRAGGMCKGCCPFGLLGTDVLMRVAGLGGEVGVVLVTVGDVSEVGWDPPLSLRDISPRGAGGEGSLLGEVWGYVVGLVVLLGVGRFEIPGQAGNDGREAQMRLAWTSMPIPADDPLVGGQLAEAHWASGVQLSG